MKRHALCIIFGIALAAASSLAGASAATTTSSPGLMASFTSWPYCTLGNQSYCAAPDTTTDPQIKNM